MDQKPGNKVNVERSQKADGRNSGHYVQGHVDNTATVVEKYMDGESLRVRMRAPPELAPYIVKKGYISIDGTSLTITEADPATGIFAVMLVPHTQKCIVLPLRAVGDRVNIEVDVMTKAAMVATIQANAALNGGVSGGMQLGSSSCILLGLGAVAAGAAIGFGAAGRR